MINSVWYITTNFLSAENCPLPTELRKEALQLQKLLEYDDGGGQGWCYLIENILWERIPASMSILYCFIICVFILVYLGLTCTGVSSHMDDEYKWVGVEDPRVMVTTSRDPSSRLKMFTKVSVSAINHSGQVDISYILLLGVLV